MPESHKHDLETAERIARVMDSRFRIPGTPIRFGFDSIIGLIPGVGDAATALPTAYYLVLAHRLGLRRRYMARMLLNTAVDFLVGAIPLIGDVFDVAFKANQKNYRLLQKAHAHGAREGKPAKPQSSTSYPESSRFAGPG